MEGSECVPVLPVGARTTITWDRLPVPVADDAEMVATAQSTLCR